MARKAFRIDKAPPAPLSVEKIAEKYGVSKTALNEIKVFVERAINATKEPPVQWRVRINGRLVGRGGATSTKTADDQIKAVIAEYKAERPREVDTELRDNGHWVGPNRSTTARRKPKRRRRAAERRGSSASRARLSRTSSRKK